jgi:hypothetical protein
VAGSQAPDSYFQKISAELVAQGKEPLGEVTPEIRKQWVAGEGLTVVPSKEHTIEMSMVGIDKLTSGFSRMTWKLIRFPAPCLFTSDHPVLYWREPDPMYPFEGIGPITSREIRVPLSPSRELILVYPHGVDAPDDAEHDGDRLVARCLNRDVLAWPANKQWLTGPDVAHHPLPASLIAWQVEWPRPWLRSGRYD